MSDFNAAQVLAEAYTLYKKHHDGMGLDFKIAINQVREESEQRGAERVLKYFQDHVNEVSEYSYIGAAIQELIVQASENRADQEGAQGE